MQICWRSENKEGQGEDSGDSVVQRWRLLVTWLLVGCGRTVGELSGDALQRVVGDQRARLRVLEDFGEQLKKDLSWMLPKRQILFAQKTPVTRSFGHGL